MGRTYSRLMLMLSLFNFCASCAAFMSTWPIPQDTPGVAFASGTTTTCSVQGFFHQLAIGAPLYNLSLSIYYVLVIAFSLTDKTIQRIEWFLHGLPLLLVFGTAISGFPLELYNNYANMWCWISALPESCGNDPDGHNTGDCVRGYSAWIYRWAFFYAPLWFCCIGVGINMANVCYLTWAKDLASQKYRFSLAMTTTTAENRRKVPPSFAKSVRQLFSPTREDNAKKRQGLAGQVAWQAFFYVLGFYIPWVPSLVLRIMETSNTAVPYFVVLGFACLYPLQGTVIRGKTKNSIYLSILCCAHLFSTCSAVSDLDHWAAFPINQLERVFQLYGVHSTTSREVSN